MSKLKAEVEVFRLKLKMQFEVEVDVRNLFRHFGMYTYVLYYLSELSEHVYCVFLGTGPPGKKWYIKKSTITYALFTVLQER